MHLYQRTVIVLLIIVAISHGQSYAQSHSSELKVSTYNIWNGFKKQPRYGNNDTLRKEKFIKWTISQNLDLIALQELVGFDTDQLYQLGQRIGLPHTILLKSSGYPVGIASKHPVKLMQRKMEGMNHGYLHVKVKGIHFFIVHLSPSSYKMRRSEADTLLQKIKKIPSDEEIIILGDFNAASPYDQAYLKKHPAIKEKYQQGDQNKPAKAGNLVDGQFDFQVLDQFLNMGFKDLVYQQNPSGYHKISFPTPALAPEQEWLERGHRIDYILATPGLAKQCTFTEIPYTKSTRQISDHYPVVATFEWESE